MRNISAGRTEFLDVLVGIAEGQSATDDLSRRLRLAIKRFGSETPDNISCADAIEVGRVGQEAGLKIRSRPLLFSEIANVLEDSTMPASVTSTLPDVTERDWAAFTRLTTLIYVLLDHRDPKNN